MFTPTQFTRSEDAPQVQAVVRVDPAEYFLWNRPLFKAPPLEVKPPTEDVAEFIAGFFKRGSDR
jgi:hypothetical protein